MRTPTTICILALLTTAIFAPLFSSLTAQTISAQAEETALRFVRENALQLNLSPNDVADLRVSDAYRSPHNGVWHIWLQQQHQGIPAHNALFGLHVAPTGQVYHLGHRFIPGLSARANTTMPSLSARRALELCMNHLGFKGFATPALRQKINERNWIFEGGAISRSDIPVNICYDVNDAGIVRLAWMLVIDQANTSDVWSIRVDAVTGQILSQNNRTQYCVAGHAHPLGETCAHESADGLQKTEATASAPNSAGGSYRVFALPAESPAHGPHTLIVDPADPIASPFGWHDDNGQPGPEYTYTRGNNVWAYDDVTGNNQASVAKSVDGGSGLIFDFPYDPNAEPLANRESAITNLFYMNNMLHDITYRFGFDEQAGNFQRNNYGKGGAQNDEVRAEGLDGLGTNENNANFSTPPDGGSGRMQMYVWSRSGGKVVNVNTPVTIAGSYTGSAASGWGAPITDVPVTGDVIITNDGTGSVDATKNCNPPVNDIAGKIAMVDRGVCQFGLKALRAQQAGAIACIICNFEDNTIGMAAGDVGSQVSIPVVMMRKTDCDLLKQFVGIGLNISLALPAQSGPDYLDGNFDNGIIAHEFGHGVSNRLTGGPSAADCLNNAEQMGEGWSDFFTLALTARPGNQPEQRRGVGTFVLRQDNNGQGIRRYPYSADMSISPLTFGNVAENTQVHALGEVWNNMTWDLYWAFVEKYGFDPDFSNTSSGNFRAIQHVMDGMKLQPCRPGFVDGRNAIMLSNILNYGGEDTCLISTVFARRGVGYLADQKSNNNAADGIENFDPIPTCIKELKISKATSTPLINPSTEASFQITLTNHKDEAVSGVVLRDELPAGLSLLSASNGGALNGNFVQWNIGDLAPGETLTLSYTAGNDNAGSLLLFRDEMESSDIWAPVILSGDASFEVQSAIKKSGDGAWLAPNLPTSTDFTLEYNDFEILVAGARPVMRFWTNFNTQAGVDAGFVEIKRKGATLWNRFSLDDMIRNGYNNRVQYGTFAIPFLNGFSGQSNGWTQAYISLADYAGDEISIRFRFGSDGSVAPANGYWAIDELEIIDMLNFDGEACVTSDQGDQACARAPESGVIVNTGSVSTPSVDKIPFALQIQPNPTRDALFVLANQDAPGPSRLQLIGADGRVVLERSFAHLQSGQSVRLDLAALPAGVYVLRFDSAAGVAVEKIVKHN